jgi:tRNA 2-thiouridine synthesizing protein A
MQHNREFDGSGMNCPGPVMGVQKALAEMSSGQVLRVVATDPGSVDDMATLVEQSGHALLLQTGENGKFVFYLRKA